MKSRSRDGLAAQALYNRAPEIRAKRFGASLLRSGKEFKRPWNGDHSLRDLCIGEYAFVLTLNVDSQQRSNCILTDPRDACESTKYVIINTNDSQCRSFVVTEVMKCGRLPAVRQCVVTFHPRVGDVVLEDRLEELSKIVGVGRVPKVVKNLRIFKRS